MRKRLYAIFLALTAAIGISGGTVFGAAKTTQVDTITLETQTADDMAELHTLRQIPFVRHFS